MTYVLQHKKTHRYVARWGSEHSYTKKLEEAQVFTSKAEAERNACVESEVVRELTSLVGSAG